MRITQGCFSFLPDLTDDQILTQVQYCLDNGWAVNIEFTDDPHPRNTYWEMWGLPMFDLADAKGVLMELQACRKIYGDRYIRLSAFDSSHGWESVRISFIVNRPKNEDGFRLERAEGARPRAALCDARLCDRPAGREALLMSGEAAPRRRQDQPRRRIRAIRRRPGAATARRRVDRPRAGQAAHPRDRGAAAGRPRAPTLRPDRARRRRCT